jgi:hypothetical protein
VRFVEWPNDLKFERVDLIGPATAVGGWGGAEARWYCRSTPSNQRPVTFGPRCGLAGVNGALLRRLLKKPRLRPSVTSSSAAVQLHIPVSHAAATRQLRPTTSSFDSTASASSSILPPRPSPPRLPNPTPLRRTCRVRPHRLQNAAEVRL